MSLARGQQKTRIKSRLIDDSMAGNSLSPWASEKGSRHTSTVRAYVVGVVRLYLQGFACIVYGGMLHVAIPDRCRGAAAVDFGDS